MMGVFAIGILSAGVTPVSAVCRWRFVKLVESQWSFGNAEGQGSLEKGHNSWMLDDINKIEKYIEK